MSFRDLLAKLETLNTITEGEHVQESLASIIRANQHDVDAFVQGGDLSDRLYDALYNHYFQDMPYGTQKDRDGDSHEWIADRFEQDLSDHLGEAKEHGSDTVFDLWSRAGDTKRTRTGHTVQKTDGGVRHIRTYADDEDEDGAKAEPVRRGRGRPRKHSDDEGHVPDYKSDTLASIMIGKKPTSKSLEKLPGKKHTLKEYMQAVEEQANDMVVENDISFQPIPAQQKSQMKISPAVKQIQTTAKGQAALDQLMKSGDIEAVQEEESLTEKLKASDDMGEWIRDFEKSTAPQFKGKTKAERREMAIAAKLGAERKLNEGKVKEAYTDALEMTKPEFVKQYKDTWPKAEAEKFWQEARTEAKKDNKQAVNESQHFGEGLARVLRRYPHEHKACQEGWGMHEGLFEALCEHYFEEGRIPRDMWIRGGAELRRHVEECYAQDTASPAIMGEADNYELTQRSNPGDHVMSPVPETANSRLALADRITQSMKQGAQAVGKFLQGDERKIPADMMPLGGAEAARRASAEVAARPADKQVKEDELERELHDLAQDSMDKLSEFLDVTVSGVKGAQDTTASGGSGGSSGVKDVTSTGTGGSASGGSATGGSSGASSDSSSMASTTRESVSSNSNVSDVSVNAQGGTSGDSISTGGTSSATNKTAQSVGKGSATVNEKIEQDIKINPSERGKYKDSDIKELKKKLSKVKARMKSHREKGKKVPHKLRGEFSELTFAIRAKQKGSGKWGDIKEQHAQKETSMNKQTSPDSMMEQWQQELDSLLNESLSISTSQGSDQEPTINVNASGPEAAELRKLLAHAGLADVMSAEHSSDDHSQAQPPGAVIVAADPQDFEDEAMCEQDMEEGNEFTGALAKAKAQGAEEFEVAGKKYKVTDESSEAAPATMEADDIMERLRRLAGTDHEAADEGKMCAECGGAMYEGQEHSCNEAEHEHAQLAESLANEPNAVTMDTEFVTDTISGGLNDKKRRQTVMPKTEVESADAEVKPRDAVPVTVKEQLQALAGITHKPRVGGSAYDVAAEMRKLAGIR